MLFASSFLKRCKMVTGMLVFYVLLSLPGLYAIQSGLKLWISPKVQEQKVPLKKTLPQKKTAQPLSTSKASNTLFFLATGLPNIQYTTPQVLVQGTAVSSMTPSNSGGDISGGPYLDVTLEIGSVQGDLDAVSPLAAKFTDVAGIVKDNAGNIYVADGSNHKIKKIDAVTNAVTTIAGSTNGFADGTGTAAKFSNPRAITYDGSANLYIADKGNHRIRKLVLATGVVSTVAGSVNIVGAGGYVDATGTAAKFDNPEGICYALEGTAPVLYIADRANNKIRKIVLSSGAVTTIAGPTTGTTSGFVDGTSTAVRFSAPVALATDGNGNLFISDFGNNRIRKMVIATAAVTTFAGSATAGSTDATGTAASFNGPTGLVFDPAGNLYVVDATNNKVRKLTTSGVVTTMAGSGTASSTDGVGTLATFNNPYGVMVDASNNLMVTEFTGNKVRKIKTSGYEALSTLPAGLTLSKITGVITGTPTTLSAATDYQIKGYNIYGTNTATLNIAVCTTPVVSTGLVWNITATTASVAGTLTTDNNATVTAKGFCLGTSTDPTLSTGTVINSADATATFSAALTGLTPGNFYFIRAYATNAAGTTYGTSVKFKTTIEAPAISYSSSSVSFPINQAITPLTLTNTGGAVPNELISKVTTIAGGGTATATGGNTLVNATTISPYVDGQGSNAIIFNIVAMASDASGNTYFIDKYYDPSISVPATYMLRKVTAQGVVSSIGAMSQFTSIGFPVGMAISSNDEIYVAYTYFVSKLIVSANGFTETLYAGQQYMTGNMDGALSTSKFSSIAGICIDLYDNLFLSDRGSSTIRKINTSTEVVINYAGIPFSPGAQDGYLGTFNSPSAIAVDKRGYVFVYDNAYSKIREINTDSQVRTILGGGAGSGNSGGIGVNANIIVTHLAADGVGNLYWGSLYRPSILKADTNRVVTVFAGKNSSSSGSGNIDGLGEEARMGTSNFSSINSLGNLIVYDNTNQALKSVRLTGYSIRPNLPLGLSMDSTGKISGTPLINLPRTRYSVVANHQESSDTTYIDIAVVTPPPVVSYTTTPQQFSLNTAISPISPTHTGGTVPSQLIGTVSTFAGAGTSGSSNAHRLSATLSYPFGLVQDKLGNIYVSENFAGQIRKIDASGQVSTYVGQGSLGYQNGVGTEALLYYPSFLAIDQNDHLYVAENSLIRKITGAANVSFFVGPTAPNPGYVDGVGTLARFRGVSGIALDSNQNLFVADNSNYVVRKITALGTVTTFAGSGTTGTVDGTGTGASFANPAAIIMDPAGNLLVSQINTANRVIRKITPSGTVTTIAGNGAGFANGNGTAAKFSDVMGLVYDKVGNLYLTEDYSNRDIRKMDPFYNVTTLAGLLNGTTSSTVKDTIAALATFNSPKATIINAFDGDLLVNDFGAHRIREVNLTGYQVTPALPVGLRLDNTGSIVGTPTTQTSMATYTIYASNAGGTDTSYVQLEVLGAAPTAYTWTGTVSSDWNDDLNWMSGNGPAVGANVVIPAGCPNYPNMGASDFVIGGDITFGNNANITVGDGNLLIKGNVTGASASNYFKTNGLGSLQRIIPYLSEYTFHVGNNFYNPISINNNSITDTFSIRVVDEVYANGNDGTLVTNNRIKCTWHINNDAPPGEGTDFRFKWSPAQISGTLTNPFLYHYALGTWNKQTGGTYTVQGDSMVYLSYSGTFSPFAIMSGTAALPLQWKSVAAKAQQQTALVQWSTETEQQTRNFIVQHSVDGKQFTSLGTVAAAGNSSSIRSYQFVHEKPGVGTHFYRIQQTDIDGKSSYSKVVSLTMSAINGLRVYPNPVTAGQLTVQSDTPGDLYMYDAKGLLVMRTPIVAGGNSIPVNQFTKGLYIIQLGKERVQVMIQ